MAPPTAPWSNPFFLITIHLDESSSPFFLPTMALPSETDNLLVQRIRDGESDAWDALIARFEGRLLAYVESRVRNRAVA